MNMENLNKDILSSCICCGKQNLPEGRQVCNDCEAKYNPSENILDLLWKSIKEKSEN